MAGRDQDRDKPTLFLIAGPNGAGKSTLYEQVIKPRVAAEFVNADVIEREQNAAGNPIDSYAAARMAAARRNELIAKKKSFVTETVFSHESKNALVEQARDAGYRIVLYHVNVKSDDVSVARVAARVKQGGHPVPEDKIRERYDRNQPLIRKAAKEADHAFIYDNSMVGRKPRPILRMDAGQVVKVNRVPPWARELYKTELMPFSQSVVNAAADSFADAKKIAAQNGRDLNVTVAAKNTTYKGKILGETALHIVQQVDEKTAVAHFRQAVRGKMKPGDSMMIRYGDGATKAAAVADKSQRNKGIKR